MSDTNDTKVDADDDTKVVDVNDIDTKVVDGDSNQVEEEVSADKLDVSAQVKSIDSITYDNNLLSNVKDNDEITVTASGTVKFDDATKSFILENKTMKLTVKRGTEMKDFPIGSAESENKQPPSQNGGVKKGGKKSRSGKTMKRGAGKRAYTRKNRKA